MIKFKLKLQEENWIRVTSIDDADEAYVKFLEIYSQIWNETCPLVGTVHKHKRVRKPWFTNGLANACKKNSLYKQFLKFRTKQAEEKYKRYKNKLVSILRLAEKQFYNNKLLLYQNDLKNTWRILNEITKRKNISSLMPDEFIDGTNIITDKQKIVNHFANFFTNIGPTLAKKIKSCPNKTFSDFMGPSVQNTLFLSPCTKDEILSVVSSFKNKTSCAHDGINMHVVKNTIKEIIDPLLHICNTSFKSGIFPDNMKTAKIIPIFKGGNNKLFPIIDQFQYCPNFQKFWNASLLSD